LLPIPTPPLFEPELVVLVLGAAGVVAVPPAGVAPPEADELGAAVPDEGEPESAEPEEALADELEDEELGVVVVAVVAVVAVLAEAEAVVEPPAGTVRVGAPVVSAEVAPPPPPPPQAVRPTASTMPALSAARVAVSGHKRRWVPLGVEAIETTQEPSGSIRLPQ
jgi:hypothetical protein